jgi:hypothetical protein
MNVSWRANCRPPSSTASAPPANCCAPSGRGCSVGSEERRALMIMTRMSASPSLRGSCQARANEQLRSSPRARLTGSGWLAFGGTASSSPRKPWSSCSKAGASKDLSATSSTTPPARPRSASGHRFSTGLPYLPGRSSTGKRASSSDASSGSQGSLRQTAQQAVGPLFLPRVSTGHAGLGGTSRTTLAVPWSRSP